MLMHRKTYSDVVYQPFSEIPRRGFYRPDSYFHNYAKLTKEEAIKTAMHCGKRSTG